MRLGSPCTLSEEEAEAERGTGSYYLKIHGRDVQTVDQANQFYTDQTLPEPFKKVTLLKESLLLLIYPIGQDTCIRI
jgi:hypothetical protein